MTSIDASGNRNHSPQAFENFGYLFELAPREIPPSSVLNQNCEIPFG